MSDYAGRTFEYITKNELKPVKHQVEDIIHNLQDELRQEGVTFQYKIIGSGGKNLVTRVVNGNTGFDFDYNFVVQKDANLDAKELKLLFIGKLEIVIEDSEYNHVSNGKKVMTIKVIDQENSSIVHSCDFAITIEYLDDDKELNQEILIHQSNNNYFWNQKPSRINYTLKLSNLKENGLWAELREEYITLKDNNQDENKKSFTLFHEAINNVYNQYEWI
jgi:hypothetical protein